MLSSAVEGLSLNNSMTGHRQLSNTVGYVVLVFIIIMLHSVPSVL